MRCLQVAKRFAKGVLGHGQFRRSPLQPVLCEFTLGDIADQPIVRDDLTSIVLMRDGRVAKPPNAAVLMDDPMLEWRWNYASENRAGVVENGLSIIRVDDAKP